jgi:hypothetical protein
MLLKASGIRCIRWTGLRYRPLRQPVCCVALAVANDVTVDPEGYTDVAMAEPIPDYGDRGASDISDGNARRNM